MKALIASLLLFSTLLAMAVRPGVTVTVKNQGDGKVSYFASQGGMLIQWSVEPELSADSTFQVSFPDGDNPEYVLFRYVKDGRYSLFPMYVVRKEGETLTIDGAGDEVFSSSLPEEEVEAIAAARRIEEAYWDYLRGKDPMGLRNDSIPSSVYGKIMGVADSLAIVAKNSCGLYPVLHQEIMLNAYRYFREVKAGHERTAGDSALLDEWERKEVDLERMVDFQNPLNALSMTMLQVFPHVPEFSGERTRDGINRFKRDYYRSFYSGLNAERLEASIIFADIDENRYAEEIPQLYEEFRSRYPESPLLPRLEQAVARNIAVNSGANDSDIVFLDSVASMKSLIERFNGAPVLVDVWASWCEPCRASFTQLEPLRKFAGENGLKLVYISIDEEDEGKKAAEKIVKKLGVKGSHVIAGSELHKDVFRTFGNSRGIMTIPHVALYDADGNLVVRRFDESENPGELIARLKTLL